MDRQKRNLRNGYLKNAETGKMLWVLVDKRGKFRAGDLDTGTLLEAKSTTWVNFIGKVEEEMGMSFMSVQKGI